MEGNVFNHTKGLYIATQTQWLEGSVGIRDVVVSGNVFLHTEGGGPNVTVGPGARNITLGGGLSTHSLGDR